MPSDPPIATLQPAPAPEPEPVPLELRSVPVSGDKPARVALPGASTDRAIIYLHGWCGDVTKVKSWMDAPSEHGTLIAPFGDYACAGKPGRFRWTADVKFLDYRLRKVVRSVAKATGRELDEERIVLVGYSEGAERAEQLMHAYPKRYTRAILMSGPSVPSYDRVRHAEALVISRGEAEYRTPYRTAAQLIARAGTPALYAELPDAAHGDFGSTPEASLGHMLGWVFEQAP